MRVRSPAHADSCVFYAICLTFRFRKTPISLGRRSGASSECSATPDPFAARSRVCSASYRHHPALCRMERRLKARDEWPRAALFASVGCRACRRRVAAAARTGGREKVSCVAGFWRSISARPRQARVVAGEGAARPFRARRLIDAAEPPRAEANSRTAKRGCFAPPPSGLVAVER